MAETTALAISEVKSLGEIFVKSGFFADTKEQSQAIVKILAGREVGLQPIEAMTGIHIVKGKITLGANLMAAAIKKSGKYNYRVTKHTDEECGIDFYEGTNKIGTSTFTLKDAKKAGVYVQGGSWDKYPRNMVFARALSNGVKWYCPDVFGHSPVYVPEEMGVDVNEEGEPINITPKPEPVRHTTATTEFPIVDYEIESKETEIESPKPDTEKMRPMPYLSKDSQESPANPPKLDCDLQLSPSIIEKVKASQNAREAYTIIANYAIQGQGHLFKAIRNEYCPEYESEGFADWMIPENAIIQIVKKASGIKKRKSEKPQPCKADGCKNLLTPIESEKREGLCREHFTGDTED